MSYKHAISFGSLLMYNPYLGPSHLTEAMKNEVFENNNKLQQYCQNYTLLCIIHHTGSNRQYTFTSYENIDFLELTTITKTDGLIFPNKDDEIFLDGIINEKYKFN